MAKKAEKPVVSAEEVIAASVISKYFKDETVKQAATARSGQQLNIKFNVEVDAEVSIGTATEKVSTVNVLTIETLAIALHCAGVTREAALRAILKAVGKTMNKNKGDAKPLTAKEMEFLNAVDDCISKVKSRIAKKLPKTTVAPRMTINSSSVKFSPIASDQGVIEGIK